MGCSVEVAAMLQFLNWPGVTTMWTGEPEMFNWKFEFRRPCLSITSNTGLDASNLKMEAPCGETVIVRVRAIVSILLYCDDECDPNLWKYIPIYCIILILNVVFC